MAYDTTTTHQRPVPKRHKVYRGGMMGSIGIGRRTVSNSFSSESGLFAVLFERVCFFLV